MTSNFFRYGIGYLVRLHRRTGTWRITEITHYGYRLVCDETGEETYYIYDEDIEVVLDDGGRR